MNLTASFLLLAVFILFYSAIVGIFTTLFRLTGITSEKASMQVISLLTNSGFTTTESEIILSSHRRRTLAQITMLFGYSFTVIIVSIIVNVFLSLNQSQMVDLLPAAIVLCGFVLLLICLFRSKPIRLRLDHVIERIGNRIMFGNQSNPVILVDTYGENAIATVMLEHLPSALENLPLSRSGLRETLDIHVLHIKRGKVETLRIDGETCLQPGDVLLVFGSYKNILMVFGKSNEKNQSI